MGLTQCSFKTWNIELEWGKTPRDFTVLVKVKGKSGYKAQLKHPVEEAQTEGETSWWKRCEDRECKDGPLRESGAGLSCCLIRRDRAGPPKREGSRLSRLTSSPAGRGNTAWLWATLSERDGELSLPAFTLILHHMYTPTLPLSHIVWNNSSWLLFLFFSFLHFPFGRNGSPSPSVRIYSDCRNPPQINTDVSSNSFKNSKGTINQALEQFSLV